MHKDKFTLIVVALMGCLGQIAADIYSPSIPAIAKFMHTSLSASKFSLAIYLYGIAASLLFYGPLADAFGRKKPVLAGLIIFLLGCVTCMMANTIHTLIIGRFVQGLGAGACAGLWRSIFRDTYCGTKMARYSSYLTLAVTVIIPLAPAVGGFLETYINWRASFAFMIIYACVVFYIIAFRFAESCCTHHIDHLKPSYIAKTLRTVFTNKIYLSYSAMVFLTYGCLFSWYTMSPVLLIHYAKLKPLTYGWIISVSGLISMSIGGFTNARLVDKFGINNMLRFGMLIILTGGILLLASYYLAQVNATLIILTTTLTMCGFMFIFPNAFTGAMQPFGHIAGFCGSFYSAVQLSGGAIFGTLIAHLPAINQVAYAILVITSALILLLILYIVKNTLSTTK